MKPTRRVPFLLALLLLESGCNCYYNYSGGNQEKATKEAQEWAEKSGLDPSKVSCKKFDSDGDGDVTCTAVGSAGQPLTLECMAEAWPDFTEDFGCRETTRVDLKKGRSK